MESVGTGRLCQLVLLCSSSGLPAQPRSRRAHPPRLLPPASRAPAGTPNSPHQHRLAVSRELGPRRGEIGITGHGSPGVGTPAEARRANADA